jgi:hypothetical protein
MEAAYMKASKMTGNDPAFWLKTRAGAKPSNHLDVTASFASAAN